MTHVLTLVASKGNPDIAPHHVKDVGKLIGVELTDQKWLSDGRALDLPCNETVKAHLSNIRALLDDDKIDVFLTEAQGRRKKLLMADMDSTIVTSETLDDLAAFAGIKDQIAAITVRAMEGEIDFHDALRERVGLLKGLSVDALEKTLMDIKLSLGAEIFVKTMAQNGAYCVLVSGGFTFFTEKIAQKAGFHANHGNILDISDEVLAGTVSDPILDKDSKVDFLQKYMKKQRFDEIDVLAIGDGANDIPMLQTAGLGIGYHPKQAVSAVIPNLIIHGDLTAALYAQGYTASDFI